MVFVIPIYCLSELDLLLASEFYHLLLNGAYSLQCAVSMIMYLFDFVVALLDLFSKTLIKNLISKVCYN